MPGSRHVLAPRTRLRALSGLAVVAAWLVAPALQAAELGHSRLVSQAGQPLLIEIPVRQLSANEAESLHAVPAQAGAWQQAGLTPPVSLDSLDIRLVGMPAGAGYMLQVRSAEVFNQPVADLLLDIRSAAGEQRYQVSLLAQTDPAVIRSPVAASPPTVEGGSSAGLSQPAGSAVAPTITVRPGDTMFAIARRHAVAGISEYQLMMALQRANPQAFIDDNVNLVRAGASLTMPDSAALNTLSDRAARRLFHQHVVAFEQGRQLDLQADDDQAIQPATESLDAPDTPDTAQPDTAQPDHQADTLAEPDTQEASTDEASLKPDVSPPQAEQAPGDQDQLRLSAAATSSASNDVTDLAGALSVMSDANAAEAPLSEQPDTGSQPAADQPSSSAPPAASSTRASSPVHNESAADDGAADDDKVAESKAIAEAEERVSQLEENVRNLNRALQSQGEAAKDLVIDGAQELRQSLSEVATAVSEATRRDEQAQPSPDDDARAELPSDADPAAHATDEKTRLVVPDEHRLPSTDDTPLVASKETSDSPNMPAAESVQESEQESGQESASALSPAPVAVQSLEPQGLGGWIWKHIYLVLASGLGLVIALMVWLFWSASRRQANQAAAITPEMVQERLDEINLDLTAPRPARGDETSPS